MPMNSRPANRRGFTLVELVLTIVILGTVTLILIPFVTSITHSPDPMVRQRAVALGQALMDEILAKRWDENTPVGAGPICSGESPSKGARPSLVDNCATPGARTASAIGADSGETGRTLYDDVDDYNAMAEEVDNFTDQHGTAFTMTGYRRSAQVRYIASTLVTIDQNTPAAGGTTDTKLVVVTVTSPLGEIFTFVGAVANI
ncbi:MAG: type IV pilus modification PilV family protein [Thermodesulfobacteriota bacterium]